VHDFGRQVFPVTASAGSKKGHNSGRCATTTAGMLTKKIAEGW
jgi:hypothetical protein